MASNLNRIGKQLNKYLTKNKMSRAQLQRQLPAELGSPLQLIMTMQDRVLSLHSANLLLEHFGYDEDLADAISAHNIEILSRRYFIK